MRETLSFFPSKMCDVEHNPKWTLHHIDELLDNVEKNANEDDVRRMLKHDYTLTPEEELFEKKFVSFLSYDGLPRGFRAGERVSVYESHLSTCCVYIPCE